MFSKFLTKISSFFFKELVLKFKPFIGNLDKVLDYSEINEDYVTYLSNILFITLIFFIIFEFLIIFLMISLNILFNFLSFIVTIVVSFTFSFMIFLLLFKYPFYLLNIKKKKVDEEFTRTIRHLSVLKDEDLSIYDVLKVFENLEGNEILSKEAKKIMLVSKKNTSLKDTFKSIINETYSEIEKSFFRKMIKVIDKKEDLNQVVFEFLTSLEQSRKEKSEQKKSKINLLFLMSVFLFFSFIIVLILIFMTITDLYLLRNMLFIFGIIFTIIEFILILLLIK